jgi:hypothetical protein
MGMIGNAPAAGIIGTGNIQDGGVETADIKDGAVVNAKLGSDLDASKLTAGTLPIARVADGAITPVKLSAGHPTWDSSGSLSMTGASSGSFGLSLTTTRVSTSARSWAVKINENTEGDFVLLRSTSNSDAASVSVFSMDGAGKASFGGSGGPTAGMFNIKAGGAAGVSWSSGLNIGDSTNYMGFIQDGGISRFRNYGSGGFGFFNSAATQVLYIGNDGALTNIGGNTILHTGNLSYIPTTYVEPNNAVPSGNNQFQPFLVSGTAPAPTGADGCVIAWTWTSGSYCSQIYIDIDPTNSYAVRTRNSAGSWQSWRNL